jgi:Right handed beta helix region
MPRLLIALALLGLPLAFSPGAGIAGQTACNRFAATWGSNAAPGTRSRPVRTPQRLVRVLHRGQRGCFRGGLYRFRRTNVTKHHITLEPYGSEAVTLNGHIKVLPSGAGSVIERMVLDGAGAGKDIGPRIYASRVALRHNEITNQHSGICVLVSRFYHRRAPRKVVIKDNRIHDCGRLPATNHHHGIYVEHAKHTVISRNWIYDNADRGIQLYPSAQGTRIVGNVIDGNGEGIVFSGYGRHPSSDNVVERNLITNSTIRYNVYADFGRHVGRNNLVRSNCIYGAPAQYAGLDGSGIQRATRGFSLRANVIADPLYVDRASKDFNLLPGSPCHALGRRIVLSSPAAGRRMRVPLKLIGRVPAPVRGPVRRLRLEVKRGGAWRTAMRRTLDSSAFTIRVGRRVTKGLHYVRIRVEAPGRTPSRTIRITGP